MSTTVHQDKAATVITDQERQQQMARRQMQIMLRPFEPMEIFDREENLQRISFAMNVGAWGIVEGGRALIIHKANLKHGEFQSDLDRLGVDYRSAARAMNVARKVGESKSDKLSLLGRSKVYLLAEESTEEEMKLLLEGETVRGLTLDDAEKMTHAELREAYRKSERERKRLRKANDAGQQQLNDANDKIDELEGKLVPSDESECMERIHKWIGDLGKHLRALSLLKADRWNSTAAAVVRSLSEADELIAAKHRAWVKIQAEISEKEEHEGK